MELPRDRKFRKFFFTKIGNQKTKIGKIGNFLKKVLFLSDFEKKRNYNAKNYDKKHNFTSKTDRKKVE